MPSTAEVDAIEPQFRRERLADLVIALFDVTLASSSVLVVDDAHWMDDTSAHLLARLESAVLTRPWSMVVTRQGEAGGFTPEAAAPIDLRPLASDAVFRLVVDATQASPLRPHEIDEVVSRAGGSPLFLEELLRAIRHSGTAAGLPDSVEAVVGAQIDALPQLPRRLLRYASVLGRSFGLPVVQQVLAKEDITLDASTTEALAEFLEPDGSERLRFRHDDGSRRRVRRSPVPVAPDASPSGR